MGLFIPYVIWTLLYYFIHVGVSYITPLRAVFNEPPITVTWKGIVDAVLNYRYCVFYGFTVFDLICCDFSSDLFADQQSIYGDRGDRSCACH